MKNLMKWIVSLVMLGGLAHADEVTMATDDNLDDFVKRVEAAKSHERVAGEDPTSKKVTREARSEREKRAKDRRQNFGAVVSAEAKRYKDEGLDKSKEFGAWVSNQRNQAGEQSGMSGGSAQISSVARDAGSTAVVPTKKKHRD